MACSPQGERGRFDCSRPGRHGATVASNTIGEGGPFTTVDPWRHGGPVLVAHRIPMILVTGARTYGSQYPRVLFHVDWPAREASDGLPN
jgi:hypothetical protein